MSKKAENMARLGLLLVMNGAKVVDRDAEASHEERLEIAGKNLEDAQDAVANAALSLYDELPSWEPRAITAKNIRSAMEESVHEWKRASVAFLKVAHESPSQGA